MCPTPPPEQKRLSRFPPVVACVVTYNSERWMRRCLSSLLASDYPNLTVLVADNASADRTQEAVAPFLPRVHFLQTGRNLGYAEGNNVGIRWGLQRGAAYLLVLNPDTWVKPDTVTTLIRSAEANRSYGMLSPLQMDYEGEALDPNFRRTLAGPLAEGDIPRPHPAHEVLPVQRMIGAALLLSRPFLEQVGGFDPLYFAYGEEDDLCRRARFHGWRMGIVPPARIGHWHTAIRDEAQPVVGDIIFRAQYIFALKDLTQPWAKRYLRFLKAWASCGLHILTRPGGATFRQLVMLQSFFWKNLFRFEQHVQQERRGPAHLALPPTSDPSICPLSLSCSA